jgi:hypothetical protein
MNLAEWVWMDQRERYISNRALKYDALLEAICRA